MILFLFSLFFSNPSFAQSQGGTPLFSNACIQEIKSDSIIVRNDNYSVEYKVSNVSDNQPTITPDEAKNLVLNLSSCSNFIYKKKTHLLTCAFSHSETNIHLHFFINLKLL